MKYFGNLFDIEWENQESGLTLFSDYFNKYGCDQTDFYCDTAEAVYCENDICKNGSTSSIKMLENKKYGIFIQLELSIKHSSRTTKVQYYSLENNTLLDQFVELGDNIFFPLGCCLNIEKASLAIEDFFLEPLVKSKKIDWVNANDIAWPEDLW